MGISVTQGYQLEIDKLLQSIGASAERLSGKESFSVAQEAKNQAIPAEISFGQAYLEPKASFTVQEYVSDNPLQESAAEKYRKSLYNKPDKEKNLESAETSGLDFSEILNRLGTENKVEAYDKVAQSYIQPQENAGLNANIMNMTKEFSYSTLDYAVNTYNYVQDINRQPHILIDFMHEYNRNYNFEA